MASKSSNTQDHSRKARIADMRRAEKARDRRNKILVITGSTVLVAGLLGFGGYMLKKQTDKQTEKKNAPLASVMDPVTGVASWDAKKLGRQHVETPVKYPMNPPVGGDHNPRWMNCNGDVYKNPLPEVNAVHSLEHGAVWVTYNDKAAKADVDALAAKVAKTPYTLMSPDKEQSGAIMLSAWGKQLSVDSATDPRVDKFFSTYVQGAQTPEPGAACTSGLDQK
ncbi:DUF3105 domain-containing protein [Streptomyces sp. NPDC002138]|uniref:DUF3105 domain-containing protein n=1 Tax=Streptomyces sp. NPDC002138 TaxID=3154410 RepID=UPI00332F08FA